MFDDQLYKYCVLQFPYLMSRSSSLPHYCWDSIDCPAYDGLDRRRKMSQELHRFVGILNLFRLDHASDQIVAIAEVLPCDAFLHLPRNRKGNLAAILLMLNDEKLAC